MHSPVVADLYTFQHIGYLFALAALIPMWVLYALVVRWKKNRVKKIGDANLVKLLVSDYSSRKFFVKFVLICLAFVLAVLSLANPRKSMGSGTVKRNGIDIMIALDVSKSMLARDIQPNRLERAKQFVAKLIDRQPDDRIGIVVFAGRAYLQMPLTSDHSAAKMYLSSASTDVVPTQGTVISDALKMCYAGFNNKEKKYNSIVLISDGEDHDEGAIKTAAALGAEGVVINTVGIGSAEGSIIEDPLTGDIKKDQAGNMVISKLNQTVLKSIAVNGNGSYLFFTDADNAVNAIAGQLKSMGQHSITEASMVNYTNLFPWLLILVFLLLVAELFVGEKVKPIKRTKQFANKLRSATSATAISLLWGIVFLPVPTTAQESKALVQKGNDAYSKKDYPAAAEQYRMAILKNSASTTAPFNLGNALYKNGDSDAALQAYDAAILSSKTPVDKASAWYNKAVVLQHKKKLPESIDAYKNALKLNPADEDSRVNLQKALAEQKKKQQEQQPKQQKPDDKTQQPKDQQKEQPKPQQSKMSKKEAEEKLKALMQQEKNLQDRLRKTDAASPDKPEKDW